MTRDGHRLTKRTTVCTENLDPCAQGRKAAAHDTHPQKSNSSKDRVDTMASAGSRVSGLLKDSYEAKVRIPNIKIRRRGGRHGEEPTRPQLDSVKI